MLTTPASKRDKPLYPLRSSSRGLALASAEAESDKLNEVSIERVLTFSWRQRWRGAVVLLSVLALFLADRLVRVENQRYALIIGLCKMDDAAPRSSFECLDRVQTRTSWFWHLYYGVTDEVPAVPLFNHW